MSSIKKHQCPSCGGNLTVDNDKQMYHCTFCGSTYDYEYFREEQMHEMGETYLSRREFMAAADAYRFVLKKDPRDFTALRGLMLAAGHLKNISELVGEDKKDFTYKPKMVSEVIEGSPEEYKDFFTEFGKVYSDKKRLSDCNNEIKSLGKDRKRIDSTIRLNDESRYEYYFKDRYGIQYSPKQTFNAICIADVIFLLLDIICIISLAVSDNARMAVSAGILITIAVIVTAVLNFTLVYPRVKKILEIEKTIGELYVETGKIGEQIRELEHESDKLSIDIRTNGSNLIKKDSEIMSAV